MDTSPIIDEVLKLWWLAPLVLIVWLFRTSWWKGIIGELGVRVLAWLMLNRKTYHGMHNVTLRTPDGTTQIDHIFISSFGIFVLETKNMQGWIFGSANQRQWTQKIYKQSFRFQNPLQQNYKHIKAVESALEVPPETIHSVVIFVGGSTFKTEMPASVTSGARFVSYIKSFRERVFSEPEVQRLVKQLGSRRLEPGSVLHRTHIRRLKARSRPDAYRLCPKCGSPLVLRTAKRGAKRGEQFWGCSAYPKCRVMQNVT
ncbi:hypothetical protein J2T55_000668 [Methylohalomonas lacus]|uniref:NERD domain-containing protein n=1 Tax=Methylohalomonas lacus TaxID=398773 RepID=A0AAE3L0K0_9GAMM|nr:NERD domain-containing protein [Methylohalomonas lacus]MCS3902664.1 hypothetical protein [Methylohalomonas lacus]